MAFFLTAATAHAAAVSPDNAAAQGATIAAAPAQQSQTTSPPTTAEPVEANPGPPQPSEAKPASAPAAPEAKSQTIGGDLGGLRPFLAQHGIDLGVSYIGEAFLNTTGGVRRGAVYEGQAGIALDADLDKLAGWPGAKAHVNAIDIHGSGPSTELLGGNLLTVSNIEARPALRLYTLWLEQGLPDDKLSLRIGKIAGDNEFAISDTAGNLINSTFGWPLLAAADMHGGGPAYPLPQPGLRLQAKPSADTTVLAAAFFGTPGGLHCHTDPQICDPNGTIFDFSGEPLLMTELQLAVPAEKNPLKAPGTYKIGGWYETGWFPDQLTGALNRRGDGGIYAIADQMVWRRPGGGDLGLSLFLRGSLAPPDRNLISWYVDGGLGWKGAIPGRTGDTLVLGGAYGGISPDAATADRRAVPPVRARRYEAVVELSYVAPVAPGITVQPDLQYVMHLRGNAMNPEGQGTIGNALVLGFRTTLAF